MGAARCIILVAIELWKTSHCSTIQGREYSPAHELPMGPFSRVIGVLKIRSRLVMRPSAGIRDDSPLIARSPGRRDMELEHIRGTECLSFHDALYGRNSPEAWSTNSCAADDGEPSEDPDISAESGRQALKAVVPSAWSASGRPCKWKAWRIVSAWLSGQSQTVRPKHACTTFASCLCRMTFGLTNSGRGRGMVRAPRCIQVFPKVLLGPRQRGRGEVVRRSIIAGDAAALGWSWSSRAWMRSRRGPDVPRDCVNSLWESSGRWRASAGAGRD
jgi:hypothetical protein